MKECKPGGCSSIGCEGGIYCFNEDGTPKVVSEKTKQQLAKFYKSFVREDFEHEQLIQERLKSIDQAVKVNIEDL